MEVLQWRFSDAFSKREMITLPPDYDNENFPWKVTQSSVSLFGCPSDHLSSSLIVLLDVSLYQDFWTPSSGYHPVDRSLLFLSFYRPLECAFGCGTQLCASEEGN